MAIMLKRWAWQRFYLVGSNRQKTCFKVLKLDRTLPLELSIMEDPEVRAGVPPAQRRDVRAGRWFISPGERARGWWWVDGGRCTRVWRSSSCSR